AHAIFPQDAASDESEAIANRSSALFTEDLAYQLVAKLRRFRRVCRTLVEVHDPPKMAVVCLANSIDQQNRRGRLQQLRECFGFDFAERIMKRSAVKIHGCFTDNGDRDIQ